MNIQIQLRNISPIFSACPQASTINLDNMINPPGGGFPFTRTRHAIVMASSLDGELEKKYVPIVPGNTMRNLLRRIILNEYIFPALQEKNEQVSIAAYVTACAGSATGNPDGTPSTFDEVATMRNHAFIGLFGGGPRMLRGRLSVENLYPVHQDTLRLLGEYHVEDAASGTITQPVWVRRVDPIVNMRDPQQTDVIRDGLQEANNWITDLLEQKSAKGKAKEKGEEAGAEEAGAEKAGRGLQAFNAHEVVIPGVDWVLNLRLENPTPEQIGLILLAASRLEQYAVAGGHSKGYGQMQIKEILIGGDKDDDAYVEYTDAAAAFLDTVSTDEFEVFATSSK